MNSGDKIVLIDNEHDLDKILKTNDRVIALVYASWCPFCRKFLPIFQQYAQEEQHYFLCVQDDQESIGDKYSIDVFPTVLFFEKGSISKRLDGEFADGRLWRAEGFSHADHCARTVELRWEQFFGASRGIVGRRHALASPGTQQDFVS